MALFEQGRRIAILDYCRTPFGKFLGALKDTPAVELGVHAVRHLLHRHPALVPQIGELVFGMARQAGAGPNPARQVGFFAGIPETTPALTINRACGSGMESLVYAGLKLLAGESPLILAGGMESMTRVPFYLPRAREGIKMGHTPLVDGMYQDGFHCRLADQLMGMTAETLAEQYRISRQAQDEWALGSQQKYQAAKNRTFFAGELVDIRDTKGGLLLAEDEFPKPDSSLEALAKLKSPFREGGSVTPGNASGINDGASAMILCVEDRVREWSDHPPLGFIRAFATAGVSPKIMGIGPVPAVRKIMVEGQWSMGDFDAIELNEAFAAQVLACCADLSLPVERVNPNGGAIAIGHPIGVSGTRIVGTLLRHLRETDGRRGLATLCISGGQGMAMVVER